MGPTRSSVLGCAWFVLPLLWVACAALAVEAPLAESDPLDWPREYTAPDGSRLELYRPQLVSWDDWERLEARAAMAVQRQGEAEPRLGIVRLVGTTEVSVRERLVRITDIDLLEVRFADGKTTSIDERLQTLLDALFPAEHVLSLDDVLADLERSGVRQQAPQMKAEPPPIFVSTSASVLVMIDGEPVWADVGKGKLQYAINTNWDLFREVATAGYYLRVDNGWLRLQLSR